MRKCRKISNGLSHDHEVLTVITVPLQSSDIASSLIPVCKRPSYFFFMKTERSAIQFYPSSILVLEKAKLYIRICLIKKIPSVSPVK
jgi:hypothetical protein